MIESYIPLAERCAAKVARNFPYLADDLQGEALLSLVCNYADGIDPALLRTCIKRDLIDYLYTTDLIPVPRVTAKRHNIRFHTVDIDECVYISDPKALQTVTACEDECTFFVDYDCTLQEQSVITLLSAGYSYRKVASLMGTSYETVRRVITGLRNRVKEKLGRKVGV